MNVNRLACLVKCYVVVCTVAKSASGFLQLSVRTYIYMRIYMRVCRDIFRENI